jgi:hypothetical protein
MNLHPFFIIGTPTQHSILRARGYETFEDIFGVSHVMNFEQAQNMWQHIANTDLDILKQKILDEYLDKLVYNQQLFLSRQVSWIDITNNIVELTH